MLTRVNSKIRPTTAYNLLYRHYCSNISTQIAELKNEKVAAVSQLQIPEAPTTCCMTGCPNCVWLDYAEKLTEYFNDGGDKAWQEINKQVTDANVRAYLAHELRMRNRSK